MQIRAGAEWLTRETLAPLLLQNGVAAAEVGAKSGEHSAARVTADAVEAIAEILATVS